MSDVDISEFSLSDQHYYSHAAGLILKSLHIMRI